MEFETSFGRVPFVALVLMIIAIIVSFALFRSIHSIDALRVIAVLLINMLLLGIATLLIYRSNRGFTYMSCWTAIGAGGSLVGALVVARAIL